MITQKQLEKIKKIFTDLKATEKNCGACGQFFNRTQADTNGFHRDIFCDASEGN